MDLMEIGLLHLGRLQDSVQLALGKMAQMGEFKGNFTTTYSVKFC